MGLSISILISTWHEIMSQKLFTLAYNDTTLTSRASSRAVSKKIRSFKRTKSNIQSPKTTNSIKRSSSKSGASLQPMPENIVLARAPSFNTLIQEFNPTVLKHKPLQEAITLPETAILFPPRPVSELDAAAVKVQKCYKGHRTRRNLADCAVVVEELWWKALDFASLKRSSVSFFDNDKQETAAAKWARAKTRVAKLGKGLSQNENAQKLALRHWLEAIDPRHRYGHNLNLYYDIWFQSESSQPFFYWLDIGDGKEISLDKCPRKKLHEQCIKYLGPKERETYEVVLEDGKLVYKLSRNLVDTIGDCKWIFVLSTARSLYVAQKKKGQFQHSSFLAGAATTAAGRLIAYKGVLEAIWPYSGHYLPTEENFKEFISFLEENHVDLSNVKKCAYNEEYVSSRLPENESSPEKAANNTIEANEVVKSIEVEAISKDNQRSEEPIFSFSKRLSCKWDTGNGPRIGCVRDYPLDLQSLALEHVNLSPRITPGSFFGPIPSPRPSPKVRISPRIAYMGLPSPRTQLTMA